MAFTAMSAAKAEPVTIASAVANKATFFISIPITSSTQSDFPEAPRAYDLTAKLRYSGNLEGTTSSEKQKTRASADFLGVMAILQKVVGRCCFSITLFSRRSA
ncbi:hypothetical protein JQ621_18230 [Bradyrhizobium manausense]|uniref:hypothetical protein n=1 Tax=Bradyrhizobium manausense TaxID=989370 RepID=UPI001BA8E31D|nr:hypothetical protein [Bradyrhizobium manausense]MBR1089403.1 hypothetical protein [Bradyrhizobium manausense]